MSLTPENAQEQVAEIEITDKGYQIEQYTHDDGRMMQICRNIKTGEMETQFSESGGIIPAQTEFDAQGNAVLIVNAKDGCEQNVRNPFSRETHPAIMRKEKNGNMTVLFDEPQKLKQGSDKLFSVLADHSVGQSVRNAKGELYTPQVAKFTQDKDGKIISATHADRVPIEGIELDELNQSAAAHVALFGEMRNVPKLDLKPVTLLTDAPAIAGDKIEGRIQVKGDQERYDATMSAFLETRNEFVQPYGFHSKQQTVITPIAYKR